MKKDQYTQRNQYALHALFPKFRTNSELSVIPPR